MSDDTKNKKAFTAELSTDDVAGQFADMDLLTDDYHDVTEQLQKPKSLTISIADNDFDHLTYKTKQAIEERQESGEHGQTPFQFDVTSKMTPESKSQSARFYHSPTDNLRDPSLGDRHAGHEYVDIFNTVDPKEGDKYEGKSEESAEGSSRESFHTFASQSDNSYNDTNSSHMHFKLEPKQNPPRQLVSLTTESNNNSDEESTSEQRCSKFCTNKTLTPPALPSEEILQVLFPNNSALIRAARAGHREFIVQVMAMLSQLPDFQDKYKDKMFNFSLSEDEIEELRIASTEVASGGNSSEAYNSTDHSLKTPAGQQDRETYQKLAGADDQSVDTGHADRQQASVVESAMPQALSLRGEAVRTTCHRQLMMIGNALILHLLLFL